MTVPRPSRLERAGDALDNLLNVILLNGDPDQPISLHAAEADAAGRRWGCILCRLLDVLIERGHCARQLADTPSGGLAHARAGVALLLLWWLLWGAAQAAFDGVDWLIHLLA